MWRSVKSCSSDTIHVSTDGVHIDCMCVCDGSLTQQPCARACVCVCVHVCIYLIILWGQICIQKWGKPDKFFKNLNLGVSSFVKQV